MSRSPTISDVSRCYRLLLGREVEDATVAGAQIASAPTVLDLVERIWASPEAARRRVGEALQSVPECHASPPPEIAADPEQLARLYAEVERIWSTRGLGSYRQWLKRGEPRYAERSARWNIDLTLKTGEAEARGLLDLLARHDLAIRGSDSLAVLGAEAFRLAPVLAPLADRYVAIEVTGQYPDFASEAFESLGLGGAEAIALEAFRAGTRRFDFFYSVETLQYAPPPVQHDLLRTLLARLNAGGVVVLQLACHLHDYRFALAPYLSGEGRDPMGEIHAITQRHVLSLLAAERVTLLEVVPDGRIGPLGVSYTFIGRKAATGTRGDTGAIARKME